MAIQEKIQIRIQYKKTFWIRWSHRHRTLFLIGTHGTGVMFDCSSMAWIGNCCNISLGTRGKPTLYILNQRTSRHFRFWNCVVIFTTSRFSIIWIRTWLCRHQLAFLIVNIFGKIIQLLTWRTKQRTHFILNPDGLSAISLFIAFRPSFSWVLQLAPMINLQDHSHNPSCLHPYSRVKTNVSNLFRVWTPRAKIPYHLVTSLSKVMKICLTGL